MVCRCVYSAHLNEVLTLRIESGRRLVEKEDLGVHEQRACNGDTLTPGRTQAGSKAPTCMLHTGMERKDTMRQIQRCTPTRQPSGNHHDTNGTSTCFCPPESRTPRSPTLVS